MPSYSVREQIIQAILVRLADILTTKGFSTDIGGNVSRGRTYIDPDELPGLYVFPGVESRTPGYNAEEFVMPVQVQAHAVSTTPSETAELILPDIREALTGERWTLPFTTGVSEIEPGDDILGATSAATGHVETVTVSSGTWAGGNAAGTIKIRRYTGDFQAEAIKIGGVTSATLTGTKTGENPSTICCGGLAEMISYEAGGVTSWPEAAHTTVSMLCNFNVTYRTLSGNPYSQ